MTPIDLAADVATRLDRLGVPYVIGGSVAATLVGEPRSTADIDIAVEMVAADVDELLSAVEDDFYVSAEVARIAVASASSFNLIDQRSALKVDLFVLGDALLDRLQLERRQRIDLPTDPPTPVWVTSTEDVVLRKLQWYVDGGRSSDRQWRDVIGVLRTQHGRLDDDYLDHTASSVGLTSDLVAARQISDPG